MTCARAIRRDFMWPILVIAIVIVALAVRSWARTRALEGPEPVLETSVDAVLFWLVWQLRTTRQHVELMRSETPDE